MMLLEATARYSSCKPLLTLQSRWEDRSLFSLTVNHSKDPSLFPTPAGTSLESHTWPDTNQSHQRSLGIRWTSAVREERRWLRETEETNLLLHSAPLHLAMALPVREEPPTAPSSLPTLGTHLGCKAQCQQIPREALPSLLQAWPLVGVGGAARSLLGPCHMSLLSKPLQQGTGRGGSGLECVCLFGGWWWWQGWMDKAPSRGQTSLTSTWKGKSKQLVPFGIDPFWYTS